MIVKWLIILQRDLKRNWNVIEEESQRALRTVCEGPKRTLISAVYTSIICEGLYHGHDIMDNNSRVLFKFLNDELLRLCLNSVKEVLKDSKMSKGDISEIVLVGGSAKIPRVQQLLQDKLNQKQ